jgi:hypothetical protein
LDVGGCFCSRRINPNSLGGLKESPSSLSSQPIGKQLRQTILIPNNQTI